MECVCPLSLRHGGALDPLGLIIWPALARTPCVSCCTPVSTNTGPSRLLFLRAKSRHHRRHRWCREQMRPVYPVIHLSVSENCFICRASHRPLPLPASSDAKLAPPSGFGKMRPLSPVQCRHRRDLNTKNRPSFTPSYLHTTGLGGSSHSQVRPKQP